MRVVYISNTSEVARRNFREVMTSSTTQVPPRSWTKYPERSRKSTHRQLDKVAGRRHVTTWDPIYRFGDPTISNIRYPRDTTLAILWDMWTIFDRFFTGFHHFFWHYTLLQHVSTTKRKNEPFGRRKGLFFMKGRGWYDGFCAFLMTRPPYCVFLIRLHAYDYFRYNSFILVY